MASWSERELEDWLWEHPQALGIGGLRWIGRQVQLPSQQVVDLLGVVESDTHKQLIVVELKATTADGEALTQLLSYIFVLKMAVYSRSIDFLSDFVTKPGEVMDRDNPVSGFLSPHGILVAPEFTKRVLLAAEELNIACKFTRQQFAFNHTNYGWIAANTEVDWPEGLTRALHDALNNVE